MDASDPMHFHSVPSAAGGISRLVSARMRELGIQLEPLLAKAGLTADQIDDPKARLKVQCQIKFLELCAAASRDDMLGFHVARDFELREIGLLYYVLSSSEILADALRNAGRYSRIVNEGISLKIGEGHDTAIAFSYVGIKRQTDRHQLEFWITSLIRICRQLTNRRLVPSRIRVIHNRAKTPVEFRSFLGSEVEFGSNADEVVFSKAATSLPIVSADPHLNELLIQYSEDAPSQEAGSHHAAVERRECDCAPAPAWKSAGRRDCPPTWNELPNSRATAGFRGTDFLGNSR
jgi:Arabinose-binding domain of AraC transcription regulator, N-term